jgi:hypothetical protein
MESRASTHSTYPVEESQAAAPVPSRKLALFALIGLTVVFIVSALLRPSTGEYFTLCGFKNLTGLPCPGCGLTHSFCALAKGRILESVEFNLLGPLLYAVLVVVWLRSACVLLNKEKAVRVFDRFAKRFNFVRAFAYSFAIFGVARIVYLLAFQSSAYQESPLLRLIARFIH